jgi:hypothetical protein
MDSCHCCKIIYQVKNYFLTYSSLVIIAIAPGMKTLLIILPFFFLVQTCMIQNTDKKSVTEKTTIQKVEEKIDPIAIGFEKQIKPIFVKNCSPCHFPGGKMYERLPFDKDTTILNHHEAILKRIKNEEEKRTAISWIQKRLSGND